MLCRPVIRQFSKFHCLQSNQYFYSIQTLHSNQSTQSESDHNDGYIKNLISDFKQFKNSQPSPSTRVSNIDDTDDYEDPFQEINYKFHQDVLPYKAPSFHVKSPPNKTTNTSLVNPPVKLSINIDKSIPIPTDPVDHDVRNLAPLVNSHVVLRELVKLGVNLAKIEQIPGVANNLVRLDLTLDVIPRLTFLKELGIQESKFGNVITKFPLIFKNKIDSMRSVYEYFQSKHFSLEALANIFEHQPDILGIDLVTIDRQLGFIQKLFYLKGDDVRHIVTTVPKIVHTREARLQNFHTTLTKQMNFSPKEIKSMIIIYPKLLLTPRSFLMKNFAFLNRTLELDLNYISLFPRALACIPKRLDERVRFLKFFNKLQLDRTKEQFTSLDAIITLRGEIFATQLGNVGYSEYLRFLKTL